MNKLFIGIVLTVLIIFVITAIVLLQPVNDVYCPVTWGECNKYGSRDSTTKFVSGRKCANVRNDMPGCDCVNSWGECNTDGVRVQTITKHRGGNGKPCAPSPSCDVDCLDSWSECDANGNRAHTITRMNKGNGKTCEPRPSCDNVRVEGEVKRTKEGGKRTEEGVIIRTGGKENIGDIIMMKPFKPSSWF